MEIQGFVIGENEERELMRVNLKREIGRDELRRILGFPSMIEVPGLHNLRIVAADLVDQDGTKHHKIEWFGQSDSCEADRIYELLQINF